MLLTMKKFHEPFVTTWVFLKDMMLSEISQAEKDKLCVCVYVCVCVCVDLIYINIESKKKNTNETNSKKENMCVY